jgi:TonB family protein
LRANDDDAGAAPSTLERAYELDAGRNGRRDIEAAAKLYAEAAAAGDAFAALRLGYLYETGDGVQQDYSRARAEYQAAADAGLPDGHLHLALCNLEGWGAPADRDAFVREMRIAADAGNVTAEQIMGSLYMTGLGVARDETLAVQWLERAAKQGDGASALSIGRNAEDQQVRQLMHDETLARSWYQFSAEKEYTDAMLAMAGTFLGGPKQDRNWALGQRWLELATESGDAEAPYVSAMYEVIGVDAPARIEAHALENLELSAHRGWSKAADVLDLYAAGWCLDAAFRHVLRVPAEERYVEKELRSKRATDPTHSAIAYKVVQPIYPYSLRLAGVEGTVLVDFVVDPTGRVRNTYALQSTHPLFTQRAVQAVAQWRFYPAQREGRPVWEHVQVPVKFNLAANQIRDADTWLSHVRQLVQQAGADVQVDASDLQIAHLQSRLAPPLGSNGEPIKNSHATLVLVVDATGRPIRGHVLESAPADVGEQVLKSALSAQFAPRMVANRPEASHQVLYFSTIPSDLTDTALNR